MNNVNAKTYDITIAARVIVPHLWESTNLHHAPVVDYPVLPDDSNKTSVERTISLADSAGYNGDLVAHTLAEMLYEVKESEIQRFLCTRKAYSLRTCSIMSSGYTAQKTVDGEQVHLKVWVYSRLVSR